MLKIIGQTVPIGLVYGFAAVIIFVIFKSIDWLRDHVSNPTQISTVTDFAY